MLKHCHCGQTTTLGKAVYRSSPPELDGHCLLCRCDEHAYGTQSPSTTTPGCGPTCSHRSATEQAAALNALQSRDTPPDLVAWYKRLENMTYVDV